MLRVVTVFNVFLMSSLKLFSTVRKASAFALVRSSALLVAKMPKSANFRHIPHVHYATLPTVHTSNASVISAIEFEKQSERVLEYLNTVFEDLSDKFELSQDYDVSYSDGVLTVAFGQQDGTYVLNKQTPNKQIWLSSPKSGPKRYDYDPSNGSWIYRHDGSNLYDFLSKEISEIVKSQVTFKSPHSG